MFTCPICKKEHNFLSCKELSSHITHHQAIGTSFQFPLVCTNNHNVSCSTVKHFMRHVRQQHKLDFSNLDIEINDIEPENVSLPSPPIYSIPQQPFVISQPSCYDSLVEKMLLKLLEPLNIPYSYIELVIKNFEEYIKAIKTNCSKIVTSREETSIDLELNKALKAIAAVRTSYKFTNKLYKNSKFVAPIPVVLGSRWETSLANGTTAINKRVDEKSYYVPILKTLASLLENPDFASYVIDEKFDPCPAGEYSCFKDGLVFRNHPLFSDRKKISLRFQLFYDGMGTTNPLRGHSANHSAGIFYFSIDNLPSHLQTYSPNIFLLSLCYSADIKKYGFDPILFDFIKDLNTLETEGIVVNVSGRGEIRFYGSISQFSGDCLAMNEIFGLICSFSHGHHCTICYADSLSEYFVENKFQLRTKSEHKIDLEDLEDDPTLVHCRGVKFDSVLNSSLFFHITQNKTIDLMHVILEGIAPYEVGCILYEYVNNRKAVTIDQINSRLRWLFSCLILDKGNTPADLNPFNKLGNGISPKLTAMEMAALCRYMPMILADLADTDDELWELLIQLQTIVDIAYAPKLCDSLLIYFSELYEDHLNLFKKLFPGLPIKPKQHYMVHFRTIVRNTGPPSHSSCIKYELHNSVLKKPTYTTCNFKNIIKSLSFKNQISVLSVMLQERNTRKTPILVGKRKLIEVASLPQVLGPVLSLKLSITRSESITTSNKAIILGQRYCKGNSVVIGKTAGKLRFGIIEFIIWNEKLAHLVVEIVENLGFDSSLNAYRIVKHNLQFKTYEVFKCIELLDFHPLDTVSLPDSRLFIRAKYHLF